MSGNYYTCLDIGETLLKLVRIVELNGQLNICGAYNVKTRGVEDGQIVSKIDFINSVQEIISLARSDFEFDYKNMIVVLPSNSTNAYRQKTELKINNVRGICDENDVKMLKDKFAKDFNERGSKEILFKTYVISYYRDDDNLGANEQPNGYKCSKIGLDGIVHSINKSTYIQFTDCLKELGIETNKCVLAPTANIYALKSYINNSKNIIIDIGGNNSSLAYYQGDKLLHYCSVRYGVNYIINQIKEEYKVDYDEAKFMFNKYSNAIASSGKTIQVYKTSSSKNISEQEYNKTIESALNSIFANLTSNSKLAISALADGNIFVTGGGAHINDIEQKIRTTFNKRCLLKSFNKIGGRDYIYNTAIGAILSYIEK